jgi:hypothetical protein
MKEAVRVQMRETRRRKRAEPRAPKKKPLSILVNWEA